VSIDDIRAENAEVTEEIPVKRGPGRPKGSGKKPAPAPPAPEGPPPEVVAQMLDSALQRAVQIPCIYAGWKPLEPQEAAMVSQATIPVINKYMPDLLGQWAPEIMFLTVALMVYGPRYAESQEKRRQESASQRGHRNGENVPGERTGPELHAVAGDRPVM